MAKYKDGIKQMSSTSKDQLKSQTSDGTSSGDIMEYIQPGMAEYKEHQANMPQYKPDGTIGDKFNTTMKRIVHNLTGPKNPNLVGGTGSFGLIGGIGGGGSAFKLIKHVLKSSGKTAVKQSLKS